MAMRSDAHASSAIERSPAAAAAVSRAAAAAPRTTPAIVAVSPATVVIVVAVSAVAATRAVVIPAGAVVSAVAPTATVAPTSTVAAVVVITAAGGAAVAIVPCPITHAARHVLHGYLALVKLAPIGGLLGADGLVNGLELDECVVALHVDAHKFAVGLKEHLEVLPLGGFLMKVNNEQSLVRLNILATLVLLALDAAVATGELGAETVRNPADIPVRARRSQRRRCVTKRVGRSRREDGEKGIGEDRCVGWAVGYVECVMK